MRIPRVLIVDDNEATRYLLHALLRGNGYEVEDACNGTEALSMARKDPPDLVISDILMPVMDGFTLCREWMKDERLIPIPFIFYTATYTDERDKEFALSLGAVRFIAKPENPDVVMAIVRGTLERARRSSADGGPMIQVSETEESVYLKQYNEVLIRKLEVKMQELEKDIAAQKQAERTLQRERDFYNTVLNSLPGVFFCYDEHLKFLRWNTNFEQVTGYSAEEIAGLKPQDFVPGSDKDRLAERITEAFDKGVTELEADLVAKDGTRTPYYFSGRTSSIDGTRCLVGVGIDISAKRLAQEQIREQLNELRRWNKAMLDREARNLELKREVNGLLVKAGLPAKYASVIPETEDQAAPTTES